MRRSYLEIVKKKLFQRNYGELLKLIIKYLAIHLSYLFNKPLSGPILGALIVTYRCPLDCLMCSTSEKVTKEEELNTQKLKEIISDFAQLGTQALEFSGGEPLLRDDIFDLICYTKGKGLFTHLSTNGYLLDEERTKLLLDSGLDAISISLDGASKETHEGIRGVNGSYERVLSAVDNIRTLRERYNKKIKLRLIMTLSEKNFKEILDLVELGEKLGADGVGFIPVHKLGVKGDDELFIEQDDLLELEKILSFVRRKHLHLENSKAYLKLFKEHFKGRKLPLRCYAGWTTCLVDTYGNIFPCAYLMMINKPAGNIKDVSLKDYWRSREYNKVRKEIKSCRECFWNCNTELSLLFNPLYYCWLSI